MKREIKFRGRRVDNGEWVYGSLVLAKDKRFGVLGEKHNEAWIITMAYGNGNWFDVVGRVAVDPETVGQFTGLKDKSGKEIYEGDKLFDPDCDGIKYVIEWNNDNASFDVVAYGIKGALMPYGFDEDAGGYGELDRFDVEDFVCDHTHVIGNIHEEGEPPHGDEGDKGK